MIVLFPFLPRAKRALGCWCTFLDLPLHTYTYLCAWLSSLVSFFSPCCCNVARYFRHISPLLTKIMKTGVVMARCRRAKKKNRNRQLDSCITIDHVPFSSCMIDDGNGKEGRGGKKATDDWRYKLEIPWDNNNKFTYSLPPTPQPTTRPKQNYWKTSTRV